MRFNKFYINFLCLFVAFNATIFSLSASAQLEANFSADKTQGCSPLLVRFSDLTTGDPSSWQWDLGNGITSTQQNPTSFYFNPGVYNVKLVVRNLGAVDSIVKSQFVTIYSSPNISFFASDTIGCVPLTVQYNNFSTAGSGTISSWQWDLGDGTISNQQNPVHTYSVAGNFSITLRVTNSFGCVKTISKPAYVTVNERMVAAFSHLGGVACRGPVNVTFQNNSVGNGTVDYLWKFGDGDTSTSANPSHTYTIAGTYPVTLIIRNEIGCVDSVTQNVPILFTNGTASFNAPSSVCQQEVVQFINNSIPASSTALWDFGDGTTSTNFSPAKSYTNTGTYTVRLINTIGNCSDTSTQTITVRTKPSADFTSIIPPPGCQLPVTVTFNNTAPGIGSYLWNFGDGGTSSVSNPGHSYTSYGSYTVSLLVTGTNGCFDSVVKQQLLVLYPPVITGFVGIPFKGCLPFTNNISAVIITPEPVANYLWNFGDGTTSTLATPTHTYSIQGSYSVSLTITTITGCTTSFTMNDAVIVNNIPIPAFSATPRNACASQEVQFTDMSSSNVSTWLWEFGDGNTSTIQNPLYHYGDTGYFRVKLTVYNNFCPDTISFVDYIYIKPPIASFTKALNCFTPLTRYFTDASVAPTSWQWSFGDGNTSTTKNPIHAYAQPGIYTVKLIVQNGACSDEISDTVRITNGFSDFTIADTMVCHNTTTTFTAQPNPDIVNYAWTFGNGNTSSGAQPVVTNIYTASNTYPVTLITTDVIGCTNTVTKSIVVNVLGPKAAFTSPAGACINSVVTFNNTTAVHPAYPLVSRVWDFGDGTRITTRGNVATHTYPVAGNYIVKLIVTDAYGCMDSTQTLQPLIITNPTSDFNFSDSIRCRNSNIQFTQTAQGLNLVYAWNFGDGGTSSLANPTYSYTNEGTYSISLTVTDQFGCTSSVSKPSSIRIADPNASFIMPDSIRSCPPFIAVLYNTSTNYSSILWDFDNGSFSTIDTPSHFYNNAGVYNIKLTVTGYGNCTSVYTKPLVIQGPSGSISYSPLALCAPGIVNFVASNSNSFSFIWDFGDGNTLATTTPAISYVYKEGGTYLPRLIILDSAGCAVPALGRQEIVVTEVEAVIDSLPGAFCDSTTIRFGNSTVVQNDLINSYHWSFGDGTTSTLFKPVKKFALPGNYIVRLIATSKKGCKDTTANIVKVVISPAISILAPQDACIHQPTMFQGQLLQPDTGQIKWRWNFGNGNVDTGRNPLSQQYALPGNYPVKLVATNSSGCIDSTIKNITIHALPNVSAGIDSTICLGQSLVLQPAGAATYEWAAHPTLSCFTCTNPVANPSAPVIRYPVTGTSTFGCKAGDTVEVKVLQPFTISVSATDTLCAGESKQLLASRTNNYTWTPTVGLSNPGVANPIATPLSTTTYTVIGSDYKNCFYDTATVPIIVYPIPVFSITNNTISIPVGTQVTIKTSSSPDITTWRWMPTTGLSCTNCTQPTFTAKANIVYKAVVTNGGDCKSEDKMTVTVTCNDGNVYIPNTFSPNNDGMNDVFYARGKGLFSIKSFSIFNRWGAVVFQKNTVAVNDPSSGWNGMYNNQPAPSDVYIYEAEIICDNNQVMKMKGNVSLVR